MKSVQGGHLCIIGGTSGIGLATARRFIDEGGTASVVGRDARRLEAALDSLGAGATGATVDASDRAALDQLFAREKKIDYLVASIPSGSAFGPFRELSSESLQSGFEGKVLSYVNVAQAALSAMAPEASITFVVGATARFANPGTVGLAAVNGAVCRIVPTLARELAPLRVNAVSPGVINTPWWDDKPTGQIEAAGAQSPLGRAGQAEDVADAILCVARNPYITGVILDVDGGLHLT